MKKKGYDDNFEEIVQQYMKDLALIQNVSTSFGEYVSLIVGDDKPSDFWGKTDMDKQMLRRMKTCTSENPIRMNTLVAFAVGYDVPLGVVEKMLKSIGLSFNHSNPTHLGYVTLLTMYRGREVDEANALLKEMGLPKSRLLGSKSRKS